MSINLNREEWSLLNAELTAIDRSSDPVSLIMQMGMMDNGMLAKASGLSGTVIKAIREGKKPYKAQRTALKYAYLHRRLNLR